MSQREITRYLDNATEDIRAAKEKLYDGGNATLIHVLRASAWLKEAETELMKRL